MWLLFLWAVKTYEDMTLEELEENEDEFGEDDEAAIEMYRWVKIMQGGVCCTEQLPVMCIYLCFVWRASEWPPQWLIHVRIHQLNSFRMMARVERQKLQHLANF